MMIAPLSKLKVKKGDTVRVMSGRSKGQQGKVLSVDRARHRVVVEHVNMVKRHLRPSAKSKGGVVEREGAIHLANVMLICPECSKPTRVAIRRLDDGQRLRSCKQCDEVIEKAKS